MKKIPGLFVIAMFFVSVFIACAPPTPEPITSRPIERVNPEVVTITVDNHTTCYTLRASNTLSCVWHP